jgi:hypothetical protein
LKIGCRTDEENTQSGYRPQRGSKRSTRPVTAFVCQ